MIAILWRMGYMALGALFFWLLTRWWQGHERRWAYKRRRVLLRRVSERSGVLHCVVTTQELRDLADLRELDLVGVHATAVLTDRGQQRLDGERTHGIRE